MADIIGSLLSGGIEGAGKGIASVINAIKSKNPEDAAKLAQMQADVQELQMKYAAEFAIAKVDENVKLNDIAGQNIRAESATGKYAAGARPSVIYAGLIVILVNYAVLALLPRRWGYSPLTIPDIVWEIWCVCVTGYVFARSGDKLLGGAGGSAQLPFGIKVDSKGD